MIVTRLSFRSNERRKRSHQVPCSAALFVALVHLRRRDALAQIAAGSAISVGTAHAYITALVDHLSRRAPGLLRVLR